MHQSPDYDLGQDACLLKRLEQSVAASGLFRRLNTLSAELAREAKEQRIMLVFSIECATVVKTLQKLFLRDVMMENELLTLKMLPGDLSALGRRIAEDFDPSPTGADPHRATVTAYHALMQAISSLPEDVAHVLFYENLLTIRRLNAHKWKHGANWIESGDAAASPARNQAA